MLLDEIVKHSPVKHVLRQFYWSIITQARKHMLVEYFLLSHESYCDHEGGWSSLSNYNHLHFFQTFLSRRPGGVVVSHSTSHKTPPGSIPWPIRTSFCAFFK